jgi:hypothetical protein
MKKIGPKIIGYTQSGKPIFTTPNENKGFTSTDHKDAAKIYRNYSKQFNRYAVEHNTSAWLLTHSESQKVFESIQKFAKKNKYTIDHPIGFGRDLIPKNGFVNAEIKHPLSEEFIQKASNYFIPIAGELKIKRVDNETTKIFVKVKTV